MKMQGRVKITVLVVVLLCGISLKLTAQADSVANKKAVTDCEATLAVATGEFNAGRFFSLPSILKGCLDKGFTNEQKIRAYILLCQVYLINDNPVEAEASYLKLLQANPEYIASPELDPIDVVYLSKKFTTRPVFTPHIRVGGTATFISSIHEISSNSEPDSVQSDYYLRPGFTLGGGIDWNMSDRISLGVDASFSSRKFSKSFRGIYDNDRSDQTTSLFWLDVPIYLKYQDYKGSFRPYGYAGYGFHVKLAASSELTFLNVENSSSDDGQKTQSPTEGTAVSISNKQYLINQSLVFGGGVKYKIGKNYVFADLRVQLGLTNVTKPEQIFYLKDSEGNSTPQQIDINVLKYNVASDLYRVNSISVTLGYIFPVYNPRKKGGWQPKGFIGKVLYGNNSLQQ
jgi:opacity protein-like surface antigen